MSGKTAGTTITTLKGLNSEADIAGFLGISNRFLRFLLFGRKVRENYHVFEIRKKGGGVRKISVPPRDLIVLQKRLAKALVGLYVAKPSAHGFLPKRSIVTNAQRHLGQALVFNLDLKDFFGSVHIGRLMKVFIKEPFSLGKVAAERISQICCDHEGRLPQGAPTSPIVSNIICRQLDDDLQNLAKKLGCRYTRYADDITFSTSRPQLPRELAKQDPISGNVAAGRLLAKTIKAAGFRINKRKVRLSRGNERQEVTGITVNEMPNLHRAFVREIDTLIFIWQKYGYAKAWESFLRRRHKVAAKPLSSPKKLGVLLSGKLAYLKMVKGKDDPICRRIQYALSDLYPKRFSEPSLLETLPPSSLLGLNGRFRGWNKTTRRHISAIKFVQVMDGEKQVGVATGFVIDPGVLITAGHLLTAGYIRVGYDDTALVPDRVYYVDESLGRDFAIAEFDVHPFAAEAKLAFRYRIPEAGEEVAAIGFPRVPGRQTSIVIHTGTVESLTTNYGETVRFLQTSFQSGGGLSGSPLIDAGGSLLGLMVENVFMRDVTEVGTMGPAPSRAYGQAIPFEYAARARAVLARSIPEACAKFGLKCKTKP